MSQEDSQAFAATASSGPSSGCLSVRRCGECGGSFIIPLASCPTCGARDVAVVPARGTGRLYSWVVAYRAFDPAFETSVPYVIALVELDEGPRIYSQLVDLQTGHPTAGLRVEWSPRPRPGSDGSELIPAFRPLDGEEEQ